MRKNRTLLRKTLSEPIRLKQQEKMAEKLKETIKNKSGSSIVSLGKVLNAAAKPLVENKNMENDVEMEEDVNAVEESPKKKISVNAKFKAKKGSMARKNPSKPLQWF